MRHITIALLRHAAAVGLLLAAAAQAVAQQEMLMGGFDPKAWEIGHQARDQNQIVVEFVRPGETVNSWTELLTMQVICRSSTKGSLDELVPKLLADLSKRCPSMKWNVVHRNFSSDTEEEGMVYEWLLKDCPPDADQHEMPKPGLVDLRPQRRVERPPQIDACNLGAQRVAERPYLQSAHEPSCSNHSVRLSIV